MVPLFWVKWATGSIHWRRWRPEGRGCSFTEFVLTQMPLQRGLEELSPVCVSRALACGQQLWPGHEGCDLLRFFPQVQDSETSEAQVRASRRTGRRQGGQVPSTSAYEGRESGAVKRKGQSGQSPGERPAGDTAVLVTVPWG